MTTWGDDDPDDRLADLLAKYDEARTAGGSAPDWSALEPADRARLERARHVLDLFGLISSPVIPSTPDGFQTSLPFAFGRFVVRKELGAGSCGVVYLADDPTLGRAVALKVPRPEVLITPDLRRRFLREAQAAAILSHPNIVPVFEASTIGGVCYTVAEYCPGPTLAAWFGAATAPVPPTAVAQAVAALAAGIGYAHCRGVVHRDLKPSNILLVPQVSDGTALPDFIPRIVDFGFAKLLERDPSTTASGVVIGTPLYMAPEQAVGRTDIGPPADIYALGAMLFELLVGRPPLVGLSTPDTLRRIVTEPAPSPRALCPTVPRDLAAICLRCLEKEPGRRYPDGEALAADLGRFLTGQPTHAA